MMNFQDLMAMLHGKVNQQDHPRALDLAEVVDWLRMMHQQISARPPVAPVVGRMYRTYAGSIVACMAVDQCGCFGVAVLHTEHPDFKINEFYKVSAIGVIACNRLDWLSMSLVEDLGTPEQLAAGRAPRPEMFDPMQPGDKVRCVDDSDGANFLHVGQIYTIESRQQDDQGMLRLNLVGMARAWESRRFAPA